MRLESATVSGMRIGAGRGAKEIARRLEESQELNILVSNNRTTTRYPVIVARELGLFETTGLKINYLDSKTSADFVALLATGEADAVMLDAPQTLTAASEKLPIAAVYETMQSAPEVLSVVRGGPIRSLEDLRGQTIGLASERDLVTAQVVLDAAGIDISQVRTIVVGDSGPVVAKAFDDRQIVAYAAGVNDTTVLAALGIETDDLTPPALKLNPANTFSVWKPRMEALRPHLETFFRVWAMATRAARLDPETVARMCRAAVPEEWENGEAGRALMDAAVRLNYPVTEAFGDLETDVWQTVQSSYLKLGLIDVMLDPSTFLDGSLISAANDFTDAEVEAALQAWRAGNP